MTLRIGNKGLTLIEVLIAVSILGLGIVSVLRAYAGSIAALEAGQMTLDATGLAKQKMAEVEQMIAQEEKNPTTSGEGVFDEPFEGYGWRWEREPSATQGLDLLRLTVSYQNDPRTIVLQTYVADKEFEKK